MKKIITILAILFMATTAAADYLACDIPEQVVDDPASITELCTGIGQPWSLCTGVGTCMYNCDEATAYNIDAYLVEVNGNSEVVIMSNEWIDDTAKNERKLLDITDVPNANYVIRAVNVQGRKSAPVPFVLFLNPSALSGLRVVE